MCIILRCSPFPVALAWATARDLAGSSLTWGKKQFLQADESKCQIISYKTLPLEEDNPKAVGQSSLANQGHYKAWFSFVLFIVMCCAQSAFLCIFEHPQMCILISTNADFLGVFARFLCFLSWGSATPCTPQPPIRFSSFPHILHILGILLKFYPQILQTFYISNKHFFGTVVAQITAMTHIPSSEMKARMLKMGWPALKLIQEAHQPSGFFLNETHLPSFWSRCLL